MTKRTKLHGTHKKSSSRTEKKYQMPKLTKYGGMKDLTFLTTSGPTNDAPNHTPV